jgi:hypothetical protein
MCPVVNGVVCDDGDPCTTDICVDGVCDNVPEPGIDFVVCSCSQPVPVVCADQTIPNRVERFAARACHLFSSALDAPAFRQRRRLRSGARALRRAVTILVRPQVRGLTPECASALADTLQTVSDRATNLADTL